MRLIDADALKHELFDDYARNDMFYPEYHSEALRIFSSIIDARPTIGGWVSVKDRLPAECENVLVYIERDAWDRKGKLRRKKDIEKGWQIDGMWHVDGCSRVLGLYWMPLPEPPKEGADG